jgi:hypothetical protein
MITFDWTQFDWASLIVGMMLGMSLLVLIAGLAASLKRKE